jgi:hypothetical protein
MKSMISGGIVFAIGIIITIIAYGKYISLTGTVSGDTNPPGLIQITIGILIATIGMFLWIYGFGQLEENRQ